MLKSLCNDLFRTDAFYEWKLNVFLDKEDKILTLRDIQRISLNV